METVGQPHRHVGSQLDETLVLISLLFIISFLPKNLQRIHFVSLALAAMKQIVVC